MPVLFSVLSSCRLVVTEGCYIWRRSQPPTRPEVVREGSSQTLRSIEAVYFMTGLGQFFASNNSSWSSSNNNNTFLVKALSFFFKIGDNLSILSPGKRIIKIKRMVPPMMVIGITKKNQCTPAAARFMILEAMPMVNMHFL